MDKKYLIIIRIHDETNWRELYGSKEEFDKQVRKWHLEIGRTLTTLSMNFVTIVLPDGIDIEITRIDE